MKKGEDHKSRLTEIADTSFGKLSDEEILQLLAERKRLEELQKQYEKLQEEEEKQARLEEEKTDIEKEIDRLNKFISPDKPDDELIRLIEERKTWELKLATLTGQSPRTVSAPQSEQSEKTTTPEKGSVAEEVAQVIPEPVAVKESVPEKNTVNEAEIEKSREGLGIAPDESFGQEQIAEAGMSTGNEFAHYLEEVKRATGSLGKVLEGLPANAKKDKPFMLEVAKVDPAYAMHYADANLKKDEDFNVKVASVKGSRNSGSALSEMLPEMRTAKVVVAGIRADYRNVRFALPQMEGYDEMLSRAKSGAMEKVQELKESVDIGLLVPKILQKDKEFMKQIEQVVSKAEKKSAEK
ncbi:MAG: hypothetical protein KBD65_03855 [Candidatus Moranbacteria bacterium]|nr:hypothetical protein [Candidatus Moranbacteria bacterium]